MDHSLLSLIAKLLRNPQELATQEQTNQSWAQQASRLLTIAFGGFALFGIAVGSYRGGLQIVFAAIKMPFVLLVPILIALPAIRALYQACRIEIPYRQACLSAFIALARMAVLASACGPVLWFSYSLGMDYHGAILLFAGCLTLVGMPGLFSFKKLFSPGGTQRWIAHGGTIVLLGVMIAQTGWLLRPFVVRPRSQISFLRAVEANVFSSLEASMQSSQKNYRGWEAKSAGLFGRNSEEKETEHVLP